MQRDHLHDPIPQLFEAAALLHRAAIAHLNEDRKTAEELIFKTDVDPNKGPSPIFDWSEALFGGNILSDGEKISPEIKAKIFHRVPDPEKPIPWPVGNRASALIPDGIAKEVIDRDRRFCRFCSIPVINPNARSLLTAAYPQALRWKNPDPDPKKRPRNIDKHVAFQALELNLDHVHPRSLGGQNTANNLIVTCAPCNCGRGDRTLAEMCLNDARERPREVPAGFEEWDGLTLILKKI